MRGHSAHNVSVIRFINFLRTVLFGASTTTEERKKEEPGTRKELSPQNSLTFFGHTSKIREHDCKYFKNCSHGEEK